MAAFALSGLQKSHAHGQNRARFSPLAPLGLRNPHKIMRARTVPSPLWGEGEGEGKHAALRGIPFTLCFLLFCSDRTRERARVVHRHHPCNPGSRPGKLPLRCPRRFFLQAIGSGAMQHPCNARPEPASLRVPPALRKHVANFQPDPPHLTFSAKFRLPDGGFRLIRPTEKSCTWAKQGALFPLAPRGRGSG